MIIAQAPVRVSFLGGGSDYPGHFEQHGGMTPEQYDAAAGGWSIFLDRLAQRLASA